MGTAIVEEVLSRKPLEDSTGATHYNRLEAIRLFCHTLMRFMPLFKKIAHKVDNYKVPNIKVYKAARAIWMEMVPMVQEQRDAIDKVLSGIKQAISDHVKMESHGDYVRDHRARKYYGYEFFDLANAKLVRRHPKTFQAAWDNYFTIW